MNKAYRFLILISLVSLFADMSYEGARSISGAYLATLGVSAFLLGLFLGLGEFLSYGLRIFSGYLTDRFSLHWLMIFLGYAMILSIPLISIANSWEIVILLLILERLGKALRTPAKDAMISLATSKIGLGKAFGIHEAMDQIGAIIGPLLISFILFLGYGYRESFSILLIPAIIALILLYFAKMEYKEEVQGKARIGVSLHSYMLFALFSTSGLASFQMIAFHAESNRLMSPELIPLIYSIAMATDAIVAIAAGRLFDRFGFKSLFLIPLLTPLSVAFSFYFNIFIGILLFGAVLGMQESIMRAGVAEIAPAQKKATAFGTFNAVVGLGFLISGTAFGFLYGQPELMILFSISCEVLALLFLKKDIKV
uniref:MFS transporter n=1 Tax=Archaeoglobus fulgidus TaxID=2234 RepID=A0A7J2TLA8_ARCFL